LALAVATACSRRSAPADDASPAPGANAPPASPHLDTPFAEPTMPSGPEDIVRAAGEHEAAHYDRIDRTMDSLDPGAARGADDVP
jgi:hypothetical protein